ncbi:MAG: hypothetical protein ACXV1K_08595 [Kineosporiaceae bacterium]
MEYPGDVAIAGVPGTAASVVLAFRATEGSVTGALLPRAESATWSPASPASTTGCRSSWRSPPRSG